MSVEHLITIQDLHYNIGKRSILKDISFSIQKGDYIGLIGPNGAGKSTLIKLILGLLKPSTGTIQKSKSLKFGYVSQNQSHTINNFPATVREIITSGFTEKYALWNILNKTEKERLEEIIVLCDLGHLVNRQISELSGGERQRVLIARALVTSPELLILDEPTTGIDISQQHAFYAFLEKLNKSDVTIFLISHDIDAIIEEVKTIICLNQKLIHVGSAEEFGIDEMRKLYGEKFTFLLHHHNHD